MPAYTRVQHKRSNDDHAELNRILKISMTFGELEKGSYMGRGRKFRWIVNGARVSLVRYYAAILALSWPLKSDYNTVVL